MNVRELKKLLDGVPDDTLVVVDAPDHHYRLANASVTTAIYGRYFLEQDPGEPEPDYGSRIKVMVIR